MLRQDLGIKGYFQVQRFCFAAMGFDPLSEERIIKHPIWTCIPMTCMIFLCFIILHYTAENITDVDKVTDALSPFCQGSLSVWKMLIFIYKRKEMVQMVKRVWAWNLEASDAELHLIAKENGKSILFCTFYHLSVLTTGTLALVVPFIVAGLSYAREGIFVLEPPLKASYFLDYSKPFNYFLVHLLDTLSIFCVIYGSVSLDTLFSWFMHNICAQFAILDMRLGEAALENDGRSTEKTITDCIQYHRRIIDLAEELNRVYAAIIFAKFAISCIQICCLAYKFSQGGDKADLAFRALFLVSVSSQLILYCYGGQRIKDDSELVATKIYATFQWDTMSVRCMKLLLLPMIRARRTCNLSGVFFVVDLSLYLWVFRTAASYITMLWTLDDKEELKPQVI